MKILKLSPPQQEALRQAHIALDGYDTLQGDKLIRIPFKLGAERRALVKNINALRSSLEAWNEIRMSIVRQHYPNKADDEEADPAADPVTWIKFTADLNAAMKHKDEIELLTFSEKAMYENGDLPALALATLDEHGLIEA